MSEVSEKAILAKQVTTKLSNLSTDQKNKGLLAMAQALIEQQDSIISVNKQDLDQGVERGISKSLLDRLEINAERIEAMAHGLRQITELPDPIGDVLDEID